MVRILSFLYSQLQCLWFLNYTKIVQIIYAKAEVELPKL